MAAMGSGGGEPGVGGAWVAGVSEVKGTFRSARAGWKERRGALCIETERAQFKCPVGPAGGRVCRGGGCGAIAAAFSIFSVCPRAGAGGRIGSWWKRAGVYVCWGAGWRGASAGGDPLQGGARIGKGKAKANAVVKDSPPPSGTRAADSAARALAQA